MCIRDRICTVLIYLCHIVSVFGDVKAVLSWPTSQSRGVKRLSGLMVLGSRQGKSSKVMQVQPQSPD